LGGIKKNETKGTDMQDTERMNRMIEETERRIKEFKNKKPKFNTPQFMRDNGNCEVLMVLNQIISKTK
jgi:hypothetical protein